MKHFTLLLILTVLLTGCWYKSPTQNIIGEHMNLVDSAITELDKNPDINRAKESLKTCRAGLLSAEQAYKAEIAECKAKTDYWRLSSAGLFVALCLAIFFIIRRKVF